MTLSQLRKKLDEMLASDEPSEGDVDIVLIVRGERNRVLESGTLDNVRRGVLRGEQCQSCLQNKKDRPVLEFCARVV